MKGKITVREFRRQISSYLKRIKAGEVINVNGVHIGLCTQVIKTEEEPCITCGDPVAEVDDHIKKGCWSSEAMKLKKKSKKRKGIKQYNALENPKALKKLHDKATKKCVCYAADKGVHNRDCKPKKK